MKIEDLTDGTEALAESTSAYVRDNPDTHEAKILSWVSLGLAPATFSTGILLWACAAIMQERIGISAEDLEQARKTFAAHWFKGADA